MKLSWLAAAFLLLSWLPCRGGNGGPDSFGYRWTDSNEPGGPVYQWNEIRELGTPLGLGDDQCLAVTLPWPFPYYGISCDSVFVCSNGYLSFSSPQVSAYPDTFPSPDPPNGLAAPLWNDLDPSDIASGGIYHYHDTVGNRYIVEWDSLIHFGSQHFYSFQAVLDGAGHSLTFLYRSAGAGWQSDPASTGIENGSGTAGLEVPGGNLADLYAVRFSAAPDSHDLEALEIRVPGWFVEPDSFTAPEMVVGNAGLSEENFPVVCRILCRDTVIYSDTAAVAGLQPGDSVAVLFSGWQAGPAGESYQVLMYADHKDDQNRQNDSLASQTVSFAFRNKISSQWREGAVVIDGVISPGEWPGEGQADISDILGKNGPAFLPGSARMYAQNDSDFLYLALDAPGDSFLGAGDLWTVWIDDNGDGAWEPGEREGGYRLDHAILDSLLFFPMPAGTALAAPGILRSSSDSGGRLQREMAVPLGTAVVWAMEQVPGGICRAQVSAVNGSGNIGYGWWPQDVEAGEEQNPLKYGLISLAVPASGAAGGHPETNIPPAFQLLQNSPNPFGGLTAVNYRLSRPGLVSLRIYDIAGRLVRTLVNCYQKSGQQQVVWDARDDSGRMVSGGVYIYSLSSGNLNRCRKMVLVK